MAHTVKSIGHVITLSTGGYIARVERYPSGRLLPAPRILLTDDGLPFTRAALALDAINRWKRDPRSVHQLQPQDPGILTQTPAPPVRRSVDALTNHAQHYEELPHSHRRKRAVKRVVPVVAKLMPETPVAPVRAPDAIQQRIDELIASGVVEVTRCPPARRRSHNAKRGGMLPGHLNPVTLGDHDTGEGE